MLYGKFISSTYFSPFSGQFYQLLIAHGWNVLYIVEDHEMLPGFYRPNGNSYYIGGVAWHYVDLLAHEIEHLRCERDFRN